MSAHRCRTSSMIATAAALSAIVWLGTPGTAEAIVPAVQYVTDTSLFDSNSPKKAVARCPVGWAVLGGGALITGPEGEVAVQSAFPRFDAILGKHVFVAKATEDVDGTAAGWSVTAGAYCTNTTAPTAVSEVSPFDSDPIKSVSVECPHGLNVVGMGGEVSLSTSPEPSANLEPVPTTEVVFRGVEVNIDLTRVTARAIEYSGALGGSFAGSWKVTVVANCAVPVYFDGLELRTSRQVGGGFLVAENDSRLEIDCSSKDKRNIAAGSLVDDRDMGQWYLDRFSRYNSLHNRIVGESYRNSGVSLVKHMLQTICVDK